MSKGYQNLSKKAGMELANLLSENCQIILPMVELIETPGRSTVEAVLLMSAADVAGERHQGRKGGDVLRHGSQAGVVALSNRKMRVTKPRLRGRGKGTGAGQRSRRFAVSAWWLLALVGWLERSACSPPDQTRYPQA